MIDKDDSCIVYLCDALFSKLASDEKLNLNVVTFSFSVIDFSPLIRKW